MPRHSDNSRVMLHSRDAHAALACDREQELGQRTAAQAKHQHVLHFNWCKCVCVCSVGSG